ncbi:MAG: ribulokinase [bacterium]
MSDSPFVIGIDFGTDSVRAIIVDASCGDEVASSVKSFRRWSEWMYCDAAKNQFRQHPLDHIESLEASVKEALAKSPKGTAGRIVGIGVDTTGSTPTAVDHRGMPLALTSGFEENSNAMFVMWKDHTAVKEAGEINDLARSWGGEDFTKYEGGIYSSEWFWSKILHILREDDAIAEAAYSWVEHCDWIPALLTGNTNPLTLKRSRCAAGHKAMWHASFDGLPSEAFLQKLDPRLKGLRASLYTDTFTCDVKVGNLSKEWAGRLGLHQSVSVAAGAFDAHLGAVGAQIEPYHLCKVMGTSTCDMLVAPMSEMEGKLVRGICGQVDGSIIPGMLGMEAGQSAFGDVYAWFRNVLMFPIECVLPGCGFLTPDESEKMVDAISEKMIPALSDEAAKIAIDASGIVALDWMNGRRTPDANQLLKGAIAGLNLGSDAPKIFRALVEATAFGAKKIVDRFISEGVPIEGVIALGGVSKKSPFVMQVVTDVLDMPIRVARSEQAVALGSAMAAATAAGVYPTVQEAQKAMGNGFEKTYHPNFKNAQKYRTLYQRYSTFGNFIERELT